eukprot:6469244-Amphidinium_carterae.2
MQGLGGSSRCCSGRCLVDVVKCRGSVGGCPHRYQCGSRSSTGGCQVRGSSQGSSVPVAGSRLFSGFFRPSRWLMALLRVLPSRSAARGSSQGSAVPVGGTWLFSGFFRPSRWLLKGWLTGSF